MNATMEAFARQTIKEGLAILDEKEVMFFKRMYSHNDLNKDIDKVVDDMPVEKLSWAMQQVENTLNKRG